jgi:ribosome-associated translation inhibitor RaiA
MTEVTITTELTGFREIDESSMDVINKLLGSYARKMLEHTKRPGHLHVTLKKVHEREKSEKYEVHAKITDNGKMYVSEFTDRNLLSVFDTVLKKLLTELTRKH